MRQLGRRWWWVLLALPLVVGLWRLRLDVDILGLLPSDLPAVRGLRLYQQHFTRSRELLLTIRAATASEAEAAASRLADALRRDTNLVGSVTWRPPWLEHPELMVELIGYLWLNQPPDLFAELTQRLAPEKLAAHLKEAREQLATSMSPADIAQLSFDPFGFTRLPGAALSSGSMFSGVEEGFASADGTFRVVYVEAGRELPDYRACAAWFTGIRAAVAGCEQSPDWPSDVRIRYTGSPAFAAEISASMASDMQLTVLTTLGLIILLFWWAHRSWRPLGWLVLMLLLVVAGALAVSGLVFGTLSAVSLGFAAILLGLAVDYGLVVYHEAEAEPHLSARELRRILAPSVVWSAITTAAAFLMLNFVGLPGLSQLGTLVGVGVLLAATVMMYVFLPIILRRLQTATPHATIPPPPPRSQWPYRVASVLAIVIAVVILARHWPPVDRSNHALEPINLPAQVALNELQRELIPESEPLLLVIAGPDEAAVARKLDAADTHLAALRANQPNFAYLLPTALWPRADRQQANLPAAAALTARAAELTAGAQAAGFTTEALALTDRLLRTWTLGATSNLVQWPTNEACRWLLKKATARTSEGWLAVGAVYAGTNLTTTPAALAVEIDPHLPNVWVTGWPLLGQSLFSHVERRVVWMVMAIVLVIGVCLRLAFRRWTEVGLSFAALAFMLLVLQATMSLAGWSWNLMNLTAVPLLLGTGVDYIIHVQVALRRHGGDVVRMRRVTGRAILLCAVTNAEGFGSNVMSSNPGLASLGLVCAIGIAAAYLTAVFLVPAWWEWLVCMRTPAAVPEAEPDRTTVRTTAGSASPSAWYRAGAWQFGLTVARMLPEWAAGWLSRLAATLYWHLRPRRQEILIENLLPVLEGNAGAARRSARSLMRHFSLKMTDLLRHESGASSDVTAVRWNGWEVFQTAQARGHGVLVITPHLGNWEFGGYLLAQQGVRLLVLTQAEPGEGLTELRQTSRARWGIETLVVGRDAFAFVEIIKRLQAGEVVAMLIDRPPPPTAVEVQLFGRPFRASVAAAELARAAGCALVPVYVLRDTDGYAAAVLPEISYDRSALGNRAARRELTQEILRAFEPIIRQHPDQWYHFVPLWRGGAPQPAVGRSR